MQARQAYQYLSPGSVLLKVRNMLATQGFVALSFPMDAAISSKLKVIQIHCPEKRCRWNIYQALVTSRGKKTFGGSPICLGGMPLLVTDAKPANNGDLIQPHHTQCLIGAHRKNGNSDIYGPGHESVVSSQVYAYYSLVLTDSFLIPNISKPLPNISSRARDACRTRGWSPVSADSGILVHVSWRGRQHLRDADARRKQSTIAVLLKKLGGQLEIQMGHHDLPSVGAFWWISYIVSAGVRPSTIGSYWASFPKTFGASGWVGLMAVDSWLPFQFRNHDGFNIKIIKVWSLVRDILWLRNALMLPGGVRTKFYI